MLITDSGHADHPQSGLAGMSRAMSAYAHEVEFFTAKTGVEALVMIGADLPDVVILDVVMTGIDGLEVLERLKSNPKTKDVEVVILAGILDRATRDKALALGARAALDKPLSAESLVAFVTGRKPYPMDPEV